MVDPQCCTENKDKCSHICKALFGVALIAILTCMSMAMWKAAWAIEAVAANT